MSKLIVANYKMNGNVKFYKSVVKKLNGIKAKDTKIVLCPPFVYLPNFKIKGKMMFVGCQDIAIVNNGKSTAQISPDMLKEFNVNYAIIGHSERRTIGETDDMVALKVKNAVDNGIVPIICVGEEYKNSPQTLILNQVKSALKFCEPKTNVVFAYEPVWAIGSGEVPTTDKIKKVVLKIKQEIKKHEIDPICLYGGSVNEQNYNELNVNEIDGFLLGGVSKNIDKFIQIVRGVDGE